MRRDGAHTHTAVSVKLLGCSPWIAALGSNRLSQPEPGRDVLDGPGTKFCRREAVSSCRQGSSSWANASVFYTMLQSLAALGGRHCPDTRPAVSSDVAVGSCSAVPTQHLKVERAPCAVGCGADPSSSPLSRQAEATDADEETRNRPRPLASSPLTGSSVCLVDPTIPSATPHCHRLRPRQGPSPYPSHRGILLSLPSSCPHLKVFQNTGRQLARSVQ